MRLSYFPIELHESILRYCSNDTGIPTILLWILFFVDIKDSKGVLSFSLKRRSSSINYNVRLLTRLSLTCQIQIQIQCRTMHTTQYMALEWEQRGLSFLLCWRANSLNRNVRLLFDWLIFQKLKSKRRMVAFNSMLRNQSGTMRQRRMKYKANPGFCLVCMPCSIFRNDHPFLPST
jgi:hypothetical protein